MSHRLPHIYSWLVIVLIFLIPSNLFLVLNDSWGYINGLRVDYILPKLFVTDLLIVPIICIGLWLKKEKIGPWLSRNRWFVFVGIVLILTQLFATHVLTSFFTVLKGLEYGLLFITLLANKQLLNDKYIGISMIFSILLQVYFASFQFIFQTSATPYWLVGESQLHGGMIGLARGNIGGEERLLAYGTTAHPNILAGTAVLFLLLLLNIYPKKNTLWLLIPVASLLFFTQSISALLALIIGLILTFKKQLITSNIVRILLFLIFAAPFLLDIISDRLDTLSVTRRAELHQAALTMLESKPLVGVGLNNFTVVLENYLQQKEFVRFIQPVHNSLWLLAAETGVVGLLLFWMICKKIIKRFEPSPVILALVPLLSLDHYLSTTQTGVLVMIFFLICMLKKVTPRRHRE